MNKTTQNTIDFRRVPRTECICDDIGQSGSSKPSKVPMYSYERPVWIFWQGFYDALRARGFTPKECLDEMQSKGVRWMLDSDAIEIRKVGIALGMKYEPYLLDRSLKEPALLDQR